MKKAFTLAETLITLGIIGVVAAITIPGLVTKHKKHVLQTQLKKTYSDLSQVIRKIKADEEEDVLLGAVSGRRELIMSYFNGKSMSDTNASWSGSVERLQELYGQHKLLRHNGKPVTSSHACDNGGVSMDLNGRLWLFNDTDRQICVDINGTTPPNRVGYDYFVFYINNNTELVPHYTDSENESGNSFQDYTYYALKDISPTDSTKTYWKDYLKF